MCWGQRSARIFWCQSMLKFLSCLLVTWIGLQGLALAQTGTAAKPTPSVSITITSGSASTSITPITATNTPTKKPASKGEIYRWVDKNGKVQYSADVPEDRLSTARRVDTRSNIVSSRVPASIQGAPNVAPTTNSPGVRIPVSEREKCEAAWQAYRAAEACFAQYRQSTAGGAGNKAGSRVSEEAQQKCPALIEPASCR